MAEKRTVRVALESSSSTQVDETIQELKGNWLQFFYEQFGFIFLHLDGLFFLI